MLPSGFSIESFKAWCAGFYEGEGSIVNDVSNGNRLRLSIAQNDRTPLDLLSQHYGGTVRERRRKRREERGEGGEDARGERR